MLNLLTHNTGWDDQVAILSLILTTAIYDIDLQLLELTKIIVEENRRILQLTEEQAKNGSRTIELLEQINNKL